MNPAFNPPLGMPPTLDWLPVAGLAVDPAYQRSTENETSRTLIRKIARFWDWSLCQPLAVTRRADGSLFVVDGQHRHAAAVLRGDIDQLPCVVTAYASLADEAAAFVSINQARKPLGKVDLFRAALAAGDNEAATIDCLIAGAGLTIAPHSNYTAWKPGMLFCVPGIQRAYRAIGAKATARALMLLAKGFEGQVLQFAGQMLEGLFGIAAEEGAVAGFDSGRMVAVLAKRSQSDWVRRATRRRLDDGTNRRSAMHAVLREAYEAASDAGAPRAAAPTAPPLARAVAPRVYIEDAPAPPPAPTGERKPFGLRYANFDEQLAAAKKHGITERPVLRRADHDGTLGGVVGEINL